jgi:hypothetical protein
MTPEYMVLLHSLRPGKVPGCELAREAARYHAVAVADSR